MTHGSKFVLIPRSSAERKGWIQVWDDVCVRNIWSRHLFFSLRERESGKSFPEGGMRVLPNLPAWNGMSQSSPQPRAPKKAWDLLWEGTRDTAQCHGSRQGRCSDTGTRVCHRLALREHS